MRHKTYQARTVWIWGSNNVGQLGLGKDSGDVKLTPQVLPVGGGSRVQSIHSGPDYAAALTEDGSLWIWGNNTDGQLGIDYEFGEKAWTPQRVPLEDIVKVSTAISFLLPPSVLCPSLSPLLPPLTPPVTRPQVDVSEHVLALTKSGDLYAWGHNNDSQLGINNGGNKKLPVLHPLNAATHFASGTRHSLALNSRGKLFSWGDNFRGELGVGDETDRATPTPVPLPGATHLAAGWKHSLVLTLDGSLWAFGNNEFGQLGLNTSTRIIKSPSKVPFPSTQPILFIGGAWDETFVLTLDGTLWVCGNTSMAPPPPSPSSLSLSSLPILSPYLVGRLGLSDIQNSQIVFIPLPGLKFRAPLASVEAQWAQQFRWLFLARSDKNSEFWGLPIEIVYHFVVVEQIYV
jgi:alpha-tubulin suppressor-like RCC1 family protein